MHFTLKNPIFTLRGHSHIVLINIRSHLKEEGWKIYFYSYRYYPTKNFVKEVITLGIYVSHAFTEKSLILGAFSLWFYI